MTQQLTHQPGDDDAQMPLGTGGDAGAPAEEYTESKARINNSTIVLIGAFAIALGVLYLLGLQNKPRHASAEETAKWNELTTRLNNLLGDSTSRGKIDNFFDTTSRLLAKLQDFDSRRGDLDIASNPFEIDVPRPVQIVGSSEPVVVAPARPDPEMLQVAQEFKELKLEGVMLGSNPQALINKQIVSIGTRLGRLTVKDIQDGAVLLSFREQVFRLEEKRKP